MNFKEKTIYQIYPKSFNDSNNDGIGDIRGIIEKLDYLQFLGVDYLWLTPFFVSPQNDNGYDVTDYCSVDKIYGTMDDVEELIIKAKLRNIDLMFDMVFNHTSITHEWFLKAMAGEQKYKDYYYFKKGKDGNPPNNWKSKFGGSAWQYVEEFDEYYLHLYDKTQADLNWDNPEVRKELIKVLQFWLDKGVKGFRFDVINNINKHCFADDPTNQDGRMYYRDGPKMVEYLKELNENSFGKYDDCITVGEMSDTTIEHCIKYTAPNNHNLDMVFNFHHLKVDYLNQQKWTTMDFDFMALKKIFVKWQTEMQKNKGWNALFWNCHDQPRSISRFGNDDKYRVVSAKMLATTIHLMQGTPYIYQGEEIGMTNNYFTEIKQYRDIETINHYYILKQQGLDEKKIHQILQAKSRDNARSPMQWNQEINSGFSKNNPWLDINPNYQLINVAAALADSKSIFYHYQKLIKLRKEYKVISEGRYVPMLEKHHQVYAYKRIFNNHELIVLNNFYDQEVSLDLDISDYQILIDNYYHTDIQKLCLKPYQSIALYKK